MVSQVFYKFKSTTSFARVQFDGHWISVGELKTLIAEQKVGMRAMIRFLKCTQCAVNFSLSGHLLKAGSPCIMKQVVDSANQILSMLWACCTIDTLSSSCRSPTDSDVCQQGLNSDATAELLLSDPRTGEDFRDDAKQIAHQSSILVRRVPALRHDALESKTAASAAGAAVPGLASGPPPGQHP